MVKVIERLFESRGLNKLKIINCVLGSKKGEAYFKEDAFNPGVSKVITQNEFNAYPLPMMTLDELVDFLKLDKLDFIKCDAEGMDVEIIKSGKDALRKFRPKLIVTTYHNDNDYNELYEYLARISYNIQGKGFLYSHGKYRVIMLHAW
jgi:FkbM family methyltransferase